MTGKTNGKRRDKKTSNDSGVQVSGSQTNCPRCGNMVNKTGVHSCCPLDDIIATEDYLFMEGEPTMNATIYAFDLATLSGWAVLHNGDVTASGVLDLSTAKKVGYMRMFSVMYEFMAGLHRAHTVEGIGESIAWERAHHRGGPATMICGGLQTMAMYACDQLNARPEPVQSMTLKKWATGSGKAGKDAMVAAARERTGLDITSDDEADAVLVGLYAWEKIGGEA